METKYFQGLAKQCGNALKPSLVEWKLDGEAVRYHSHASLKPSLVEWKRRKAVSGIEFKHHPLKPSLVEWKHQPANPYMEPLVSLKPSLVEWKQVGTKSLADPAASLYSGPHLEDQGKS